MVMVRRLLHLAKAEAPIFFVFFKMVTFLSALQPENALLPMDSTLLQVETRLSALQPQNALLPMAVTVQLYLP